MNDFITRCHGSSAALPTPYRLGRVDLTALEGLCYRLIERGTAALAPCGTTGEGSLLTPDEHRQVVETTVEAAAGRVPVIAGAGSNNTRVAVELARSAERAGASALLAVTPFYLKPSQAGIVAHFRAIHDAVGIPVILYDVPARTGCALDDVTVKRLADLPRIVGLKRALWRLGLMGDSLRLPLTPLSPEFDKKLGQVLDAIAPVEENEARRFIATHPHHAPHAA